ncbi:hypothetical protein HOY80DRAFT_156620 [Tuber brumale]|nr:hypothetical protein HOY80DRAFT_156620 [Tuber brumale]
MANKSRLLPWGGGVVFFRSIIRLLLSYHRRSWKAPTYYDTLIFFSIARVRVMLDSLTNRREGLAVEKSDLPCLPAPPAPFFLLQESHPSSSLSCGCRAVFSLSSLPYFPPPPSPPLSFSLSLSFFFCPSPKQKPHPLSTSFIHLDLQFPYKGSSSSPFLSSLAHKHSDK